MSLCAPRVSVATISIDSLQSRYEFGFIPPTFSLLIMVTLKSLEHARLHLRDPAHVLPSA